MIKNRRLEEDHVAQASRYPNSVVAVGLHGHGHDPIVAQSAGLGFGFAADDPQQSDAYLERLTSYLTPPPQRRTADEGSQ